MAKFFTKYEREGLRTYHTLFVCDDETPIPTGEEIVKRLNWNPHFASAPVKRISRLRWFFILMCQYAGYIFGRYADELIEYAPNGGNIHFWEWWDNEADI